MLNLENDDTSFQTIILFSGNKSCLLNKVVNIVTLLLTSLTGTLYLHIGWNNLQDHNCTGCSKASALILLL